MCLTFMLQWSQLMYAEPFHQCVHQLHFIVSPVQYISYLHVDENQVLAWLGVEQNNMPRTRERSDLR